MTNDKSNKQLENIEEIASNDEAMEGVYIPRKSRKNGLFTQEEFNIREDGIGRNSNQVDPMRPESEGNHSYFRENSSYYANSPKAHSRGSNQSKK